MTKIVSKEDRGPNTGPLHNAVSRISRLESTESNALSRLLARSAYCNAYEMHHTNTRHKIATLAWQEATAKSWNRSPHGEFAPRELA